ncbi:TPA: CBS domain-containing protein [Legionella pneumophila]|nr:CBS domain-containing protein [Legionella pneumophila]HAU1657420.1 CBS domain-containing protein [Legionella pneumophila]
MRIGEFCNRDVVMMNGDESVKQAAELMRAHHVGDIVLVEELKGHRVPIGIVTDRDLVIEVMALDVNPEELAVQDIVTRSILVAREEDSLIDSLALMQEKGVRRLPVVDNEHVLVGIITIDDITELLAEMLHKVVGVVDRQQKVEKQQRS